MHTRLSVMSDAQTRTVTQLLEQVADGDRAALNQVFPLVYDELREIAHSHRRRWHGDETLGTTALVHEAYVKLVHAARPGARSRAYFLAVAGKAMRQILSNYARAWRRQRRGGHFQRVPIDALPDLQGPVDPSDDLADDLTELEAALARLEQFDTRLSRIVECRFFAAMSIAETATALNVSPATVKRDWALARAWLYREMQE
jgi:RNA polymerase sigma factor (TIGR02999 family)